MNIFDYRRTFDPAEVAVMAKAFELGGPEGPQHQARHFADWLAGGRPAGSADVCSKE
jgi:hypothetical protein